jgi:membrane-bound acyltransferase YfiQ involved in biofilm formation
MYGTFFLIGYLIGRDEGFWNELERMRVVTLAAAVVCFGLLMTRDLLVAEGSFALADEVRALITYSNRWLWIIAIFGWGHRLLNRPSPQLSYATQAVYPWYILHQTVTIVIAANVAPYSLGPVVEPALVLGGTIAGCYVLYEFVIRRVRILQPLFGVSIGR